MLTHSPNGHNGSAAPIQSFISHMGTGIQAFGLSSAAFLGAVAGSCTENEADTAQSVQRGRILPCHNAGPKIKLKKKKSGYPTV